MVSSRRDLHPQNRAHAGHTKGNIGTKVSDHALQGAQIAATAHASSAHKGAKPCTVVFVSIDALDDFYVTEGAVPVQFFSAQNRDSIPVRA